MCIHTYIPCLLYINIMQVEQANTDILSGKVEGTKLEFLDTVLTSGKTQWSMKFAPGVITTVHGCLARLRLSMASNRDVLGRSSLSKNSKFGLQLYHPWKFAGVILLHPAYTSKKNGKKRSQTLSLYRSYWNKQKLWGQHISKHHVGLDRVIFMLTL